MVPLLGRSVDRRTGGSHGLSEYGSYERLASALSEGQQSARSARRVDATFAALKRRTGPFTVQDSA